MKIVIFDLIGMRIIKEILIFFKGGLVFFV